MKAVLLILLCATTAAALRAQTPAASFSAAARTALQDAYTGWRLQENYGQSHVRGDFDGDGYPDHALHIHYPDTAYDRTHTQALVVVLERAGSAEVVWLESADVWMSLYVVERGTTVCVVHTDHCFELAADAVEVGYEEKASWLYRWDGAAFVQVPTGD